MIGTCQFIMLDLLVSRILDDHLTGSKTRMPNRPGAVHPWCPFLQLTLAAKRPIVANSVLACWRKSFGRLELSWSP
jgi:hypothetical protein